MPLKFLNSGGSGSTNNALSAFPGGMPRVLGYFPTPGEGYGTDTALQSAINTYSDAIFFCATGNDGVNIDSNIFSRAGFSCTNIILVAATGSSDTLASWSNYGVTRVDVAVPGVSIYSTIPWSYGYKSGTSMSTPHVAGLAALVKAVNYSPTLTTLKQNIMSGVDVISGLLGKCVTGGRVNAFRSLTLRIPNLSAKFCGIPGTTVNPLTIQYYEVSSGNPKSWNWNFGDGYSSTTQNTNHAYTNAGTYTVSLSISN